MNYIKISNTNEIDVKAFTLLGASTKRGDSTKIGFFGSGLKYALAVLLRNEIEFKIFSGLNEIKVTTKQESFRDQIFNKILINGEETSMTKEMGVDWLSWFAVREIYCNALDEKDGTIKTVDSVDPVAGETHFYVELSEKIKELMDNWDVYFNNRRMDILYKDDELKIFSGSSERFIIYRRGVQCYQQDLGRFELSKHCVFHYDVTNAEINESRVLKYLFLEEAAIMQNLGKYATHDIIKELLNNIIDSIEGYFEWGKVKYFNENWIEVIGARRLIPAEFAGHFVGRMKREESLILPSRLIRALKNCFKNRIEVMGNMDEYSDYAVIEPEKRHLFLINECLSFLVDAGFHIKYPVKVCLFQNKDVLGSISSDSILLSTEVLERGKKTIVSTLIEEAIHLDTKYPDETRGLQDFLINKIVTLLEEKTNVYL